MSESEVEYPIIEPDEQKLLQLSAGVQKRFDIELLGIDMIIENATGRYAVIDVNVFPGGLHLQLSLLKHWLKQPCCWQSTLLF